MSCGILFAFRMIFDLNEAKKFLDLFINLILELAQGFRNNRKIHSDKSEQQQKKIKSTN